MEDTPLELVDYRIAYGIGLDAIYNSQYHF